MHAACGWASLRWAGVDSMEAARNSADVMLIISTVSVYMFIFCRAVLALGESGLKINILRQNLSLLG